MIQKFQSVKHKNSPPNKMIAISKSPKENNVFFRPRFQSTHAKIERHKSDKQLAEESQRNERLIQIGGTPGQVSKNDNLFESQSEETMEQKFQVIGLSQVIPSKSNSRQGTPPLKSPHTPTKPAPAPSSTHLDIPTLPRKDPKFLLRKLVESVREYEDLLYFKEYQDEDEKE